MIVPELGTEYSPRNNINWRLIFWIVGILVALGTAASIAIPIALATSIPSQGGGGGGRTGSNRIIGYYY